MAVRLNLLGQPGEHPDFVVAAWVLPYVYALRGDRDWRRSPQLTGSRQVSPLAIQAYKLLEAGESNIPQLKHTLGREVTEGAVLRAITELWQQLRIIPVIAAPGKTPKWQLLRMRFQKAIAEGASTSQVTAISVLASIYLQAVIAASMEDVELFLVAADGAQQGARSAARAGGDTPGAHHFAGPCAAFLRGRNTARVCASAHHLRQFVHAGFELLPACLPARGRARADADLHGAPDGVSRDHHQRRAQASGIGRGEPCARAAQSSSGSQAGRSPPAFQPSCSAGARPQARPEPEQPDLERPQRTPCFQ